MPLYIAQVEQTKPFVTHFRQMSITFTAANVEEAAKMIDGMIEVLHLGNTEIVELYRDEKATAW